MNTTAPIILQQELTTKCNNKCSFCYNPERCIKAFEMRSQDQQRNLEVAKISVDRGVMAACPTGGEPMLVGDHLFEVLSIYKSAGCYTSINSNGRLIDAKAAAKLRQAGLNSALVSIHGIGHVHNEMVGDANAFAETWQGIKNLMSAGVSVTPNFVATAKNIAALYDVGTVLADIGIPSMAVTPFLPSWGSESHAEFVMQTKHYQTYFETVRKIRNLGVKIDSTLPIPPCVLIRHFPDTWQEYLDVHSPRVCMAGKSFGVVSPDGYFRSCVQAPYLPRFGGYVLGNYQESWQNANRWAEKKLLPEKCLNCQALDVCGGGCRTGCMWENNGCVYGSTMYMGEPLSKDQAALFIQRVKVNTKDAAVVYRWNDWIKVRNEDWGIIVFNPLNQSFTVLSSAPPEFTGPIVFSSAKTAKTLDAIGVVKPIAFSNNLKPLTVQAQVLSANIMLPRLAVHIGSEKKVFCLRADTGERYFF